MTTEFAGKRVVVMGLGRFGGGIGVTRWLAAQGAKVLVTDRASEADLAESLASLKDLAVEYRLGGHDEADLVGCCLLVVNPAVDKRKSEFFRAAAERRIPWTSEMNLFLERCRGRIVGVTGTVGKSTTTAMIGAILRAAEGDESWRHGRVRVGGNIGKSLLDDLAIIAENDVVVLELSSFQLEDAAEIRRSPQIAVVTNLRENHLDRHDTLDDYAAAKANIYNFQTPEDWLVLPFEGGTERLPGDWSKRLRIWRFGVDAKSRNIRWAWPGEAGSHLEGVRVDLSVPGLHNLQNAAAALAVARILGVRHEVAAQTLLRFEGLPHRLEFVCERAGVRYYNDSKATTPEAAMTSVTAFDHGLIVLVGGSDKGISFAEMGRVLATRAKAVVCMGATGPRIAQAIGASAGGRSQPSVCIARSFEEAVRLAERMAKPGDVVLLSPGCASFDWFRNYEQRGEVFRNLVQRPSSDQPPA